MMVSIFASIILIGLGLFLVLRKRSASNIPLSIILFLLGLQEALDQVTLYHSVDAEFSLRAVLVLQSLLPALFLFLSVVYSRPGLKSITSRWWVLIVSSLSLPLISVASPAKDLFFITDLRQERILYLESGGYWVYFAIMFYLTLALINIESTFVSLNMVDRKKVRLEVLGLISVIGFLIFYLSQGILYRAIDMNIIPVRAAVMIISTSLIGFSMFRGAAKVSVGVSRYVIYRSLTLMLLGTYFIILGISGQAMRYFGISFSRVLMVFLAIVLAITMLVLVSSERLKSRAKVFISKHFFRAKHDYREEWLKFTELLSSCRTTKEVEHMILRTYCDAFALKGASLYEKLPKDYQFVLSSNELMPEVQCLNASKTLLDYFGRDGRVYRPGDGEYGPTEDEVAFTSQTDAFALVPLAAGKQGVDTIVVLGKQVVEEPLLYEDYDLMKNIAKQAALALLSFRLSAEIAQTREIAAVTKVSTFVIHDLKNLAASLSLMINNADIHIGNPDFQMDMLLTVRSSIAKMESLIKKLRCIKEKSGLNKSIVDIARVIDKGLIDLRMAHPDIAVHYEGNEILAIVDREEIERVLTNLVLNAIEACDGRGQINVRAGTEGKNVFFCVQDNGRGISEDFRQNHLFKPFHTSKEKGLGIGLFQCKHIVEAHGGRIEVASENGRGASFVVYLPRAKKEETPVGDDTACAPRA